MKKNKNGFMLFSTGPCKRPVLNSLNEIFPLVEVVLYQAQPRLGTKLARIYSTALSADL